MKVVRFADAPGFLAVAQPWLMRTEVEHNVILSLALFWDHDRPVAMLSSGGNTLNGARVSLVYTPKESRRRGYATAAVAALTNLLFEEGRRYCCLYTELANPTSNSIYQQVGYRPVCDINDYLFAA